MPASSAMTSRPCARLVVVVVALIAAAVLLGFAGHHDDAPPVAHVASAEFSSIEETAPGSAVLDLSGSDEVLACSIAILCCVALLVFRRALKREPLLGTVVTVRAPVVSQETVTRAYHPAIFLEALSISRT